MGGGTSFPVVPLSKERVVVVTGSNTGLGYEIAKWTAMMGATVIMACRSEERARKAITRMNEEFKAEKAEGTKGLADYDTLAIEFMKLDLASFNSVVEFSEAYKQSGRPLHVLFCNAGLGLKPYVKTDDGYELCLQVNYLGHFLLIAKLLPVMKQSGEDCRILMMSSFMHSSCRFDIKTLNYEGPPEKYPESEYYSRSKLYQIMQMYSMVRHKSAGDITVNSINPGFVATEFLRDSVGVYKCLACCCRSLFASKPKDGARCSIDCTVNPKLAGVTGTYFSDFKRLTPSRTARDEDKQEALWEASFDMVKQHLTEDEIAGMRGK